MPDGSKSGEIVIGIKIEANRNALQFSAVIAGEGQALSAAIGMTMVTMACYEEDKRRSLMI